MRTNPRTLTCLVCIGVLDALSSAAPARAAGHDDGEADASAPSADDTLDGDSRSLLDAFVPIHVLPGTILPGAPDLTLSGASATIDTTALTVNNASSPYFVSQGNYSVLLVHSLFVQCPVIITGSSPLIVVSSGAISIAANIDLRGNGLTAGPGAAVGGPGVGGAGTTMPPIDLTRWSSGGGGGGYGTVGGAGGIGSSGRVLLPGGAGGLTYGPNITDPLTGGSRGGIGGFGSSAGAGAGGGGGGALQLSSQVSIDVSAAINAGGGGGIGGRAGQVGGGGGGAGGAIILEAPAITLSGVLAANGGGGGGGGGAGGSGPPPGLDGSSGAASATPAPGGAGGVPQGSHGGAGAAGATAATAGASGFSKGGGGGGGAGRIWLRYLAATPPNLTGVISPAPGLDPTL
jgi:hypothetical protein